MSVITIIGIVVIILWLISLFIYFRTSSQQHTLYEEIKEVSDLLEGKPQNGSEKAKS